MIVRTLVLVAAVALAGTASAQPSRSPLPLTLDDAVRRAVAHNPDLTIVRLSTEVDAAHVGESLTAYTPLLSSVFGRSSAVAPPTNFLLGDGGIDTRDWFSSVGVRQRVPWGNGTWSVSWDAARTTSNSLLTSFDPAVQSGLQVAFSQPLLKDRAIDTARQQFLIAKRNEQSSELRFREAAVQTVAAVKQAYWTLKALRANVGVQQRSLELAEELARQNEVRVRLGQAPPIDLVQVQAEVADRREGLIRARAAEDDAEDRLRRVVGDSAERRVGGGGIGPGDGAAGPGAAPRRAPPRPKGPGRAARRRRRRRKGAGRALRHRPRAQRCRHRHDDRRIPVEPDAARCARRSVVPRQRPWRIAAAADRRIPGQHHRPRRFRVRRRARTGVRARLPDLESWRDRQPPDRPQFRAGQRRPRQRRKAAGRRPRRQSATRRRADDSAGRAATAQHGGTRRCRPRRRIARGAAVRRRAAPLRRRLVHQFSRHASAARSAPGTGQLAAGDA